MIIKPNTKNRTCFLLQKESGVEVRMTTPLGSARTAKILTLQDKGNRVQLNGRQINALEKVLNQAAQLSV